VVVLALTTGATDAITFLRLGSVFSSVITGNLALLGVAAGRQDPALAVSGGLALAGYGLGVILGAACAGRPAEGQPIWPGRVTITLAAEFVVLAGFSGGWWASGGHPAGAARLTLLVLAAGAMGMESSAVRRLGQMSATYLTSTLTGVLEGLVRSRWPRDWPRSAGVLAAMVTGALLGALADTKYQVCAPAAVMAPLAAVLAGCLPDWRA
jgi:uncharacterized membrane protein YoaK (UPF0700 family)